MAITTDPSIFEKMILQSLDMHCVADREGNFLYVSPASLSMLGYTPPEMVGCNFIDFVRPQDMEKTLALQRSTPPKQNLGTYENCYRHKQGHDVPIEWTATWSEEEQAYFCVGRNATEKRKARKKLKEKEELHNALVQYGGDMLALLDGEGTYTYVGGSMEKVLGYQPEDFLGKKAESFIHPEDLEPVQAGLAQLSAGQDHVRLTGCRFRTASGTYKWVDTAVSNQLDNPNIRSLVVSSRDITEQVEYRNQLEKSELKYRNLFEKSPDPIIHLSPDGHIVEVNQAFQQVLGFRQAEVVNQPLTAFMSPDSSATCSRYFAEALLGNTMRFDLDLYTQAGDRKIFDMVMYPLTVKGETIGVETIAKDITSMVVAYETIQRQAQKLNAVLESITDAFFTVDHDLRFTYINQELERLLGIDRGKNIGKSIDEVFPEDILKEFYHSYRKVQATREALAFEIYLAPKDVWLGVKFFPANDGLSVYLLDITQRVAYQQELKMLSLVASKTTNGVVIMDANQGIQWVNDGFTHLNGYTLPEVVGKRPSDLLQGPGTSPEARQLIIQKYAQGEPFVQEVLNYKKNGEEFWVRIAVTPIKDPDGKVIRFIGIQNDITAQKKADESQARLTKELSRQNRDLQQFTYIVSHNLRAPVANVIGLANLLHALDKHSANFDLTLLNLDKSILAIDAVLKDLNEILSIGFTKDTVSMEAIDLAAICQQALDSLQDSLNAFGGQVEVQLEEGVKVYGNKPYLFSVFHNLLSNAIKYRSPDRTLQIKIRSARSQQYVVVFFSDNGLGFDDKKQADKLFKLYMRFHKGIEGRGIGLFLVKTQIDAMGGEIEVSSTVNVGTRFLIHLKGG